jgi:hypothetical protein
MRGIALLALASAAVRCAAAPQPAAPHYRTTRVIAA